MGLEMRKPDFSAKCFDIADLVVIACLVLLARQSWRMFTDVGNTLLGTIEAIPVGALIATNDHRRSPLIRWSIQEIRRIAGLLLQKPSTAAGAAVLGFIARDLRRVSCGAGKSGRLRRSGTDPGYGRS